MFFFLFFKVTLNLKVHFKVETKDNSDRYHSGDTVFISMLNMLMLFVVFWIPMDVKMRRGALVAMAQGLKFGLATVFLSGYLFTVLDS